MKLERYLTEQVFEGKTTTNNGHSHKYRADAIGTGFTTFDDTKHIHAIAVWKCKTSQGHEHQILDNVSEAKIPDLRKDYDEKAAVADGTLYRKGNIVQVWWLQDVLGRKFTGTKGRETWTAPSELEAKKNFNDMKQRWVSEAIKKVKKPDFMIAMGQEPEYVVKEISPDVYQLAKFTHGKEPQEIYRCQWTGKTWKCNCYSRKGSCKHIDHVQKFIKGKKRSVFDKWADKVIKL